MLGQNEKPQGIELKERRATVPLTHANWTLFDHKRLGRTVITTSLLHGINLNLAACCKCALNTEKKAPKLSAAPACGIVFKAKKL